ncbi:MAG: hypothetical protein ABIM99_03675 [Candidatus Dojkabacteria bacterium]
MRNKLAIITTLILVLAPFSGLMSKLYAADVTAYIDLTAGPATAPATITTQPELAQSTADEFYISYIASATQFAIANTVSIVVPSSFTSLALCAVSTTDADGDATPDGAATLLGQVFTYTFSAVTTLATTTGVEICFAGTTPAANGNYNVSVSDNNDNDTSAALIYVGTAGAADTNDVTVTATVGSSISLAIKNPTTTANTNSCNLGSLNTGSVNTCAYRIAAGTNIAGGMNVQTLSDGPLTSGGNNIDNVADGAVTAGAEEHGVAMTAGTGWTLVSPFDAGDDPITTTQQKFENRTTVSDDTNTALWTTVTHKASISTATVPGVYTAIMTYRAYALP